MGSIAQKNLTHYCTYQHKLRNQQYSSLTRTKKKPNKAGKKEKKNSKSDEKCKKTPPMPIGTHEMVSEKSQPLSPS